VVLVCHVGGVLGYFGVVVNTPRKLHSAGPTNRDYPIGHPVKDYQKVSGKKESEPFWDKVLSKETAGR